MAAALLCTNAPVCKPARETWHACDTQPDTLALPDLPLWLRPRPAVPDLQGCPARTLAR